MTALVKHDPGADSRAALYVLFKVGSTEYGLAAENVLQMESYRGATTVPGVAPFIAGVVQVRGRIVPVVDLRIRFGEAVTPPSVDHRIVVGQRGERVVGLLVDSAREVVSIGASQVVPPPPLLGQLARGFVGGVAHLGPRLVLIVDFAKIIGEEALDVID